MAETNPIVTYRAIPGYPDYRAGDDGSVWSSSPGLGNRYAGKGWRLLKNRRGNYLSVALCRDGKATTKEIHRLVLESFVGPCPPRMEACHNNGNRHDNRLCNLRWDTRKNNHADKKSHGTHLWGSGIATSKLSMERAAELKARAVAGEPAKSLAVEFGISARQIRAIRSGERWAGLPGPTLGTIRKQYTFRGKTQFLRAWARDFGFPFDTLWGRIRYGWDIERALTTPARKTKTST